jgi:hypothetical protein
LFINIFIERKEKKRRKRWGGSVFANTKWEGGFLDRGDPIGVGYV